MLVELAQIPLVDGDIARNTRKVVETIEAADVSGGTSLLAFPETTLCGFPTRANIAELAQTIDGPALGEVCAAARRKKVAVAVGMAEREGAAYFNTTVLIDESGHIVLRYRKTHLWGSDLGVFTPGERFAVCRWNGISVGLLICYDIEFPETARALALLQADLLIVTNGNMDPYGPVHRRAIVARAMENQVFALMVNRCGAGAGKLRFPGESVLVDPFGELVAEAAEQEVILRASIDLGKIAKSRARYCYVRDARVALRLRAAQAADGSPMFVMED